MIECKAQRNTGENPFKTLNFYEFNAGQTKHGVNVFKPGVTFTSSIRKNNEFSKRAIKHKHCVS